MITKKKNRFEGTEITKEEAERLDKMALEPPLYKDDRTPATAEQFANAKAEHILENRAKAGMLIKSDKKESLAKCLAITLLLSKEQYEALSPDAYKKLFGDWKQKELNCLYKLYEDGLSSSTAEARQGD